MRSWCLLHSRIVKALQGKMRLTLIIILMSETIALNVTNSTEDVGGLIDLAELTEERIVGGSEVYPPHKYPFQVR